MVIEYFLTDKLTSILKMRSNMNPTKTHIVTTRNYDISNDEEFRHY